MLEGIDYSVVVGSGVEVSTGEIIEIKVQVNSVKLQVASAIESSYSQDEIHRVQQITWPLGEHIVCKLLGCKRMKNKNHKGYDALLSDGTQIEIKVGRIGNSTVIKRNQLETIGENSFYVLVYYRTRGNLPPSYFISNAKNISGSEYLKRNIFFESIFIFPKKYMVYFYNTTNVKEGVIKGTGIRHKPLCQRNATNLFNSSIGDFEKKELDIEIGRHSIKVYSVGLEI